MAFGGGAVTGLAAFGAAPGAADDALAQIQKQNMERLRAMQMRQKMGADADVRVGEAAAGKALSSFYGDQDQGQQPQPSPGGGPGPSPAQQGPGLTAPQPPTPGSPPPGGQPTQAGQPTGSMFGGMQGWAPGERPIAMGDAPTGQPGQGQAQPASLSQPGGQPQPRQAPALDEKPGKEKKGPELTLESFIKALKKENPNISPRAMNAAVQTAMPYINQEERRLKEQEQISQKEQALRDRERMDDFMRTYKGGEQALKAGRLGLDISKASDATRIKVQTLEDRHEEALKKLAIAEKDEDRKAAKDEADKTYKQLELARRTARDESLKNLGFAKIESGEKQTAAKIEGRHADVEAQQAGATGRTRMRLVAEGEKQGMKDEAAMARLKENIIARREAIESKDQAAWQRANLRSITQMDVARLRANTAEKNAALGIKSKEFIAGQRLETLKSMQEAAINGKFNVAKLNREAIAGLAAFNAQEKRTLAEFFEARRMERWTGEEMRRSFVDRARIQNWNKQAESRDRNFEMRRQMLNPTTQELVKRAENWGFDTDRVSEALKYFRTTGGKYPDDVNKLPPQARSAVIGAINQLAKDQKVDQADLNYNRQKNEAAANNIKQFTNPSSPTGQAIRGISVTQGHSDTLIRLANAWNPSDTSAFRAVAKMYASQFGYPEFTSLEMASKILGPEIIRSLGIRGGATGGERIDLEEKLSSGSLSQIYGGIKVVKDMLAQQAAGYKKQWMGRPEDFDAMLTDTARDEMNRLVKQNGSPFYTDKQMKERSDRGLLNTLNPFSHGTTPGLPKPGMPGGGILSPLFGGAKKRQPPAYGGPNE